MILIYLKNFIMAPIWSFEWVSRIVLWPQYDLLSVLYTVEKDMYYALFTGMYCKCQLGWICWYHLILYVFTQPAFPLLWISVSHCRSITFLCFKVLGTWMFIIIISFLWIDPVISRKLPSLFLVILFAPKIHCFILL